MPTLFLLRHAKSSWEDSAQDDRDRPLSPRGRRAAAALSGYIASAGIQPDLVLCSPARRTRETLEAIRPSLGDQAETSVEEALYGASAGDLMHRLRSVGPATGSVLLVGHNPGIQELAMGLTRAGNHLEQLRGKFPTGALATVELPGTWEDLAGGTGRLEALVLPRDLAPGL